MTDLRSRLIRLAAANPGLRAEILPLLQEQADPASHDQNKPEHYYGLPPRGVQAARRGDENRVVFVVGTSGEEGPLVVNVANKKKYPYDGTPEGLAATLQEAATTAIRFQSMDFLDGPEINVVKAPRVPPSLAEMVSKLVGRSNLRQPDYPSPQTPRPYVALRGTEMGLEWRVFRDAQHASSGRLAGCEKLPEGGMRDNCEKKQEEGKENKGKEASFVGGVPRCDGEHGCMKPVTWIDNKGFAYCEGHGKQRLMSGIPARKLNRMELEQIQRGELISRFASGKEAATVRKAHGPVAIRQPEVMLYAIDASASAHGQSKFYEMKVVPFGTSVDVVRPTMQREKDFRGRGAGGFTLVKRWGRLTDSGSAGRVDAMDEYYDTEVDARAAMQETKSGKMRGSGSARYTDVSRAREYPIGLGGSGFGWGGQQACNFVPELRELRQAVTSMNATVANTAPSIQGLAQKNSDVGRRVSTMLGELQGTLGSLQAYLDDQMRHCG